MRTRSLARLGAVVALLVAAALPGCGSTPPARFFELRPRPAALLRDLAVPVIVRPVQLPAGVDRAQMVTRVGPHELTLHEFERWAEPLDENVARVLVANLAARLGADSVVCGPAPRGFDAPWEVELRVTELELELDAPARLAVRWFLFQDGLMAGAGVSAPPASAPCEDHEAMADALSDALDVVSGDIAELLVALRTNVGG